jgi:hypothetical protein
MQHDLLSKEPCRFDPGRPHHLVLAPLKYFGCAWLTLLSIKCRCSEFR